MYYTFGLTKMFLVTKIPPVLPGLVVGSNGSPGSTAQWSNTHCGKACPPVRDLRSAVKPKDSFTGK